MKKRKITARQIALSGMMVAVIEASKWALSFLPNIELTSFCLILFTLIFGRWIMLVVPVFILIEGAIYGFGIWWLMYLYAWPLLVLITYLFRRQDSALFWAILSGAFGLSFGALCAIPYIFIGVSGANPWSLTAGLKTAFAWWIAGIPWDVLHCAANFVLMIVLYKPVIAAMRRMNRKR